MPRVSVFPRVKAQRNRLPAETVRLDDNNDDDDSAKLEGVYPGPLVDPERVQ
jgi:hypothetical protein